MKLIDFNLNNYVHFELTEFGRNLWSEHNTKLLTYPTRLQMWRFMEIFGQHIYNGGAMPIKDCNVKIEVSDDG